MSEQSSTGYRWKCGQGHLHWTERGADDCDAEQERRRIERVRERVSRDTKAPGGVIRRPPGRGRLRKGEKEVPLRAWAIVAPDGEVLESCDELEAAQAVCKRLNRLRLTKLGRASFAVVMRSATLKR